MKTHLIKFSCIVLAVLSSCIPQDTDEIAGIGTSLLRIDATDNFNLVSFDAVVQTRTVVTIRRDAVSQADLAGSTSVDFELDNTIIDDYNTANELSVDDGTAFLPLPEEAYSFVDVSGSTFEFGSGEFIKEIEIELDPSYLDLALKYALPVRIKNPGGSYKILNNADFVLVQIIVKNQYDGIYASVGTRFNFIGSLAAAYTGWDDALNEPIGYATTFPWEFDTPVGTRGPNTVAVHLANLNGDFGFMNVTINPDNSILIETSAESGFAISNFVEKDSYYDPDTKTMYLYYTYENAAGNARILKDELVYKGPQ